MRMRYLVALTILGAFPTGAQEPGASGGAALEERDQLIRERYEQVLTNDPLQEAAFDRVYESYMLTEGVDAWLEKLKPGEGGAETAGGLVLRGRILARQFKAGEAVETLSKAREMGEASPAFNALLGRLYYETGKDADAIALLGAALDATESPEQRSAICRMLGSVYLRSGQRAEAAAVWERIAELNPNDLFALQELAEIYEENRLWDEAIAARQRIVAAAANDPYRQCHAWRAIGQSLLAKEDHAGAIAAYEQGLALAAPGNWLFEDLKGRLVGVYESRGDLEGLSAYLEARIAQDATDLSLAELLADVTLRRGDLSKAEALLKDIVARSPGRESALEMLIDLYRQAGRPEELAATFEVLIAQYPNEPDYLRRLGEAWLEQKSSEKAQETWRRVVGDGTKASNHALLATWLERSEFFPEAAAAYEAALAIEPEREWRLRLASLKYDMGEEEAALAAWQAAVAAEDTPAGEVAEIASILLSKEFKAEAEALYARAMALEPENLDHVLAYARLLSGRADHAGAVTQYTRLAEQDTSEYLKNEGERGLLDAYEALGTLEAQRTAWEEAIAQAPDDTVARLKLARLYARMGMRPAVVKIYEECAAIDPARIEFQRVLATAYKENRQTDKAVAVLEGLMDKDGARAQAYLRDLLALYGTLGQPQEAIRSAEKLVELSPASPEARTALAQAYLRNGEPEKGLQQYRDLVQIDGTQPAYFRDFGDALQGLGKFGEAQEIYRKMLDAASDDTTRLDAVNRLAAVYVRNGQRDSILSEFQRRVSAAPKSLAAYQELAAVHRASGDMQGALETLERAKGEVEDRDAVLRLLMTEAFQAGDNLKVVAVYEELLARSAQPTPNELDRLAGAYAQVGRMDEALVLWDRIAKESPDDAAVQLMVARQLEQFGFYDESNASTERALEIDPYDYALRFDYAQRLIGFNEVDKALAQMKAILDIGERPEAPQGSAPAASSVVPQPGSFPHNTGMNPRSFRGNVGGGGSRWYGQSFGELRQQVVQSMVHLSRQYEEGEPLIDTYKKRIDEQPENIDARRDYLLVCEASEDHERALAAAKELLVLQPEDDSLRWRIFGYLQQLGRVDEALAAAVELAASPNEQQARQARLVRIRLLAENGRFEEAETVLAEMASDQPEMAQIYLQVASSFQNAADSAVADTLYQKAADLDPRFRHQATTGRARLLQERGETAAARDLYIEAVFAPAVADPNNPVAANPRVNPMPLYMPQGGRRNRQPGGNLTQLQGFNHPMLDHQRAEALNQAFRLAPEPEVFAPVIVRLRDEAAKYVTAESDAQRQVASNFVFFLVTSLRATEQDSEALGAVESLLARRPGDAFLQNLRLFLLDDQGQLDAMKTAYGELEASNPANAGDVARARLQIALLQEDAAALPTLYRALPDTTVGAPTRNRVGIRASQLNQVVRALENAGAKAEARALLEEELARSREYRVFALLVRSLGEAGEHDQAIAYAREAWEKQGSPRNQGSNLHYSMDGMTLQSQGLHGLEMLWNTYRLAGRESELIAEFEGRIDGQPTSVTLRQSLIGLYMESKQYDLARAQMEKLLELRPNDMQLKVRYAGLLESNNDPSGALAVLESVATARPSVARGISGEIRRLYKDLGKKEELAALDEQLIREARSAEQLQQLARQLAEERDFAKAAELMQKALRIEPENIWLQTQVGDYLWQADQKNEAVDAYFKFLQPATPQHVVYIDAGQMPQIIQRVAEAGRLEELKAIAASTQTEPMTARALKILCALIARHEKRPEDAEAILKSITDGGGDQQVFTLLADLAEGRNDPAAAIQYLEAAIPTGGTPDYRRIATLHLKTGNTEKSIQSWKKFAEQQGGYAGFDEAVRHLAETGADDALEIYFRDVYGAIPASDPARRRLAGALIRANEQTGRHDALIEQFVFDGDSKDGLGELAREYAGNYDTLPGLAARRIGRVLEQFPRDMELLKLQAEILHESGDLERALEVHKRIVGLMSDEDEYDRRYLDLLREAGQSALWERLAIERAKSTTKPNPWLVQEASEALIASGRREEIPALREAVLAKIAPDGRAGMLASFARFDASLGDVVGARAVLRQQAEGDAARQYKMNYYSFLTQWGFLDEAAALIKELPQEQRSIFSTSGPSDALEPLLASGDWKTAWEQVQIWLRAESDPPGSYEVGQALEAFRRFGVSGGDLDRWLEPLRTREDLSLKDRIFLADCEIALGRWPAALMLFEDHREVDQVTARIGDGARSMPAEIRETLLRGTGETGLSLDPFNRFGATGGDSEPIIAAQFRQAETALEAGMEEEALSLLDRLALEDGDPNVRLQRARLYEQAGAFDRAFADLDAYRAHQPEDPGVHVALARVLARSGKVPEALIAWRAAGPAGRSDNALELATVLVEGKYPSEASEVLGAAGLGIHRQVDVALLQVRIMHQSLGVDAMLSEMEKGYRDLSVWGKLQFVDSCGAYMVERGLWKDVLGTLVEGTHPARNRSLLKAARRLVGEENREARSALVDVLIDVTMDRVDDSVELSEILDELGRRDDAIAVLKRAMDIPPAAYDHRYALSTGLTRMEAHTEAALASIRMSDQYPGVLYDHNRMFEIVMNAAGSPASDALLARLVAMARNAGEAQYWEAIQAWNGPDKVEGLAKLVAFAEAPSVAPHLLSQIASLMYEEGGVALALKVHGRFIAGEYGSRAADSSRVWLIAEYGKSGDFANALSEFARLIPGAVTEIATAREALMACAASKPIEEADGLILDLVRAAPTHSGVSDLLALRSAIAAERGILPAPLDLAALGVSEEMARRAALWSNLITSWAISRPIKTATWADMTASLDEPMAALLRGEVLESDVLKGWRRCEPRKVFPDVVIGEDDTNPGVALEPGFSADCLVEIESPDERSVTLSHGSRDWTRIWVNGTEVYSNPYARLNLANTERFELRLRQGVNRILVRSRAGDQGGAFSLSILENGTGLLVRAPELTEDAPEQ